MFVKTLVATRGANGLWSWEKLPKVQGYKKSYQRTPQKFTEEKGSLYLLEVDRVRLNKSFTAALKIVGTTYALVLMVTKGKRNTEFHTLLSVVSKHKMTKDGEKYIKMFEKIIRDFGVYVGKVGLNDTVFWYKDGDFPIDLVQIKKIYRLQPDMFYVLDGKLYYLRCIQNVAEDMFFKCVELAGGEHKLAVALSTDEKSLSKHLMNFRRLGFKQVKTFQLYVNLFSEYLKKNVPLFEVDHD